MTKCALPYVQAHYLWFIVGAVAAALVLAEATWGVWQYRREQRKLREAGVCTTPAADADVESGLVQPLLAEDK